MDLSRIPSFPAEKRVEAYRSVVKNALEAANSQDVKQIIAFVSSREMSDDSGRYWIIPATFASIVELTEDKAGSLSNNIDLDDVPDVIRALLRAVKECQKQDEDIELSQVAIAATALLSDALAALDDPLGAAEARLTIPSSLFPSSHDYIKFAMPACKVLEQTHAPSLLPYVAELVKVVKVYEKDLVEKEGGHVVDTDPLLLSVPVLLAAADAQAGAYLDAASKQIRIGKYTQEQLSKAGLSAEDACTSLLKGMTYLCVCRRVPVRESLLAKCCDDPRAFQHPLFFFVEKLRNNDFIRKADVDRAKATNLLPTEVLETTNSALSQFEMSILEHNLVVSSQKYDSISLTELQTLSGTSLQVLDEAVSSLCYSRRIPGAVNQKNNVVYFFKDEDSSGHLSPAMTFWNKEFATLCNEITSQYNK